MITGEVKGNGVIDTLIRLTWNATDFGNFSVVRIDPVDIWLPDVEVYNSKVNIK